VEYLRSRDGLEVNRECGLGCDSVRWEYRKIYLNGHNRKSDDVEPLS